MKPESTRAVLWSAVGLLSTLACAPALAQSHRSVSAADFPTYGSEWISDHVEIRGNLRAEAAVAAGVPASITDRSGRALVRLELGRTPADTLRWLDRNGCRTRCDGLIFRGQVVVSPATKRPALMLTSVSRPAQPPAPAAPRESAVASVATPASAAVADRAAAGSAQANESAAGSARKAAGVPTDAAFLADCRAEASHRFPNLPDAGEAGCQEKLSDAKTSMTMANMVQSVLPMVGGARAPNQIRRALERVRWGVQTWRSAQALDTGSIGDLNVYLYGSREAVDEVEFRWGGSDGAIVPYDLPSALKLSGADVQLIACSRGEGYGGDSYVYTASFPGQPAFRLDELAIHAYMASQSSGYIASIQMDGKPATWEELHGTDGGDYWQRDCRR